MDWLGNLFTALCWAGTWVPFFRATVSHPACRLALYVYEYLLHVGAQKSAQTFLSEVSLSALPRHPTLFLAGLADPSWVPAPHSSSSR